MRDRLSWVHTIREPERACRYTLDEWQRVNALARKLRLLPRLAQAIEAAGLMLRLPAPVQRQMLSARRASDERITALRWAVERLHAALHDRVPLLVLLKGAAYLAQRLPISLGRVPADVDILVPKEYINIATSLLAADGWQEVAMDQHDRRYYREWSHEVPPMTHPAHRIEVDLHHNILPPVAKIRVDADLLLARVQPSPWHGWSVLSPIDQLLHCASHLFQDSEARGRLRDLVDLDGLFRQFGSIPGFWADLTLRATELGLNEPLSLACALCVEWLETPIPPVHVESIEASGPSPLHRRVLLELWAASLLPTEPQEHAAWTQDAAARVLLARYHHQRMPLHLLVPHLWHKLRKRAHPGGSPPGVNAP